MNMTVGATEQKVFHSLTQNCTLKMEKSQQISTENPQIDVCTCFHHLATQHIFLTTYFIYSTVYRGLVLHRILNICLRLGYALWGDAGCGRGRALRLDGLEGRGLRLEQVRGRAPLLEQTWEVVVWERDFRKEFDIIICIQKFETEFYVETTKENIRF